MPNKIGIIRAEKGEAVIRTNIFSGKIDVSFTGLLALPVIHRVEVMDISLETFEIERRGADGLICRDAIPADLAVTFFVRIGETPDDVVKVALGIGCERASEPATLEALFTAKFSEALESVVARFDFEQLRARRSELRSMLIAEIGQELNGYYLEDCTIDHLEQTPVH